MPDHPTITDPRIAAALPPPPPAPPITTVLAVVTGDPTIAPALCAVRYDTVLVTPGDPLCGEAPLFRSDYTLLATQRLEPGAGYPDLAARVNRTARRLYDRDRRGDYHVLVDASGIGKPVVDAIRGSIIPQVFVTGVTITTTDRGDPSILWRTDAVVGLSYLVSRLQALIQGRRLHIPAAESALLDALHDFTLESAEHAYLVRALALATAAEHIPVGYDFSPDELPSPDF